MTDYDEDDDEMEVEVTYTEVSQPEWALSAYDLVGVTLQAAHNLAIAATNSFMVLGNTWGRCFETNRDLIAREFYAAANHQRTERDEASRRRLLADDLASLERGELP